MRLLVAILIGYAIISISTAAVVDVPSSANGASSKCGGAIDVDETTCEPLIKLRPDHPILPPSPPTSTASADDKPNPLLVPPSPDEPSFPPLPAGITGTRITRLSMKDQLLFANGIASLDLPVILTDANKWQARHKWKPSYIKDKLASVNNGRLEGVKKTRDDNKQFFYYHYAPFNSHPSLVSDYKPRTFDKINMSAADFFRTIDSTIEPSVPSASADDQLEQPMDGYHYSYAGKLDDWGAELFQDVYPLEPMMVLPENYKVSDGHLHRKTYVWAGSAGAVTPLHYDLYHNFYQQLEGWKYFLLIPPTDWEKIYLYPILHPGGRSSQVDLSKADPTQATAKRQVYIDPYGQSDDATSNSNSDAKFGNFHHVNAIQAMVGPGDVLYVPPLWFHHVQAITPSISVSVWSHANVTEYWTRLSAIPLPIGKQWPHEYKVAALRLYIESAFDNLGTGMNIAEFIDWSLLQSRYRHIGTASDTAHQRYCYIEDIQNEVLDIAGARDVLMTSLSQFIDAFKPLMATGGRARRDIFLADWIEISIHELVGPLNVKQFLYDMCYC